MKRLDKGILIALLAGALAACETQPVKEQMGTVAGGVPGGVLGATVGEGRGRTAAIVGGTLAGAYLGSRVGKSMDKKDSEKAAQTLETSPTASTTSWRNPYTGRTYTVTPTRTYTSATGPCRDFTTRAVIDGHDELVQDTACRQPDGSWKTM
ncbi:MAG TPA: RT0821/Lpp0805 family surface protein [Burkholderiales bacterium]|nr:RT0821/Lpp0805 family surface protein [Burkholderiales bacterium]